MHTHITTVYNAHIYMNICGHYIHILYGTLCVYNIYVYTFIIWPSMPPPWNPPLVLPRTSAALVK